MKSSTYTNETIILTSSCKITKGKSRSLIVDYLRNELFFISNDYYQLLKEIDRKPVSHAFSMVDSEDHNSVSEFIEYLLENEIIMLSKTPELFPQLSEETDDFELIRDSIIEVDPKNFIADVFSKTVQQLNSLRCNDIQLRLYSEFSTDFIHELLCSINNTDINYIELHFEYDEKISREFLLSLIEDYPSLSHIFVYNAPENRIYQHKIQHDHYYPLLLGNIYYAQTPLNSGSCCGIITQESMNFDNILKYNELKQKNGCLYKKVTIDKEGNIKNCPSMKKKYGNIKNAFIENIIKQDEFQFFGNIKKDEIAVCQDCEFRYACTDCRAFLQDSSDVYSKPLKCGYNPETCVWEDWSANPLKNRGKVYE